MQDTCTVTWNDTEIGMVKNISRDMWYLDGDWIPYEGKANEFEQLLSVGDARERLRDLSKLVRVILSDVEDKEQKMYCLAMSLDGDKLAVRQVVAKEALDTFFPDR